MYANLKVTYRSRFGRVEEVFAWEVARRGARLVIRRDGQDGGTGGSHPEPAGEIEVHPDDLINVAASF